MRSAIVAALLVASATATPWGPHRGGNHQHRPGKLHGEDSAAGYAEETVVDLSYSTVTLTVTAGGDEDDATVSVPAVTSESSAAQTQPAAPPANDAPDAYTSDIDTSSVVAAAESSTTSVVSAAEASPTSAANSPPAYNTPVVSAPKPYTSQPAKPQTEYSTSKADSSAQQPAPSTAFPYPSPAPTKTYWSSPSGSSAPPCQADQCQAGSGYADKALNYHNEKRRLHQANDLVWDEDLAAIAQKHADTCNYGHDIDAYGGGYGQNIAGTGDLQGSLEMWYNEVDIWPTSNYGNSAAAFTDETGHFTAMVWASTTAVGCASSINCGGQAFTVCNYFCFPNMAGEFGANVLPASSAGGYN